MESAPHYFSNYGFIVKDLPKELLDKIKQEVSAILNDNKNNNEILVS